MLYIAIHNAKHAVIFYALIVSLCVFGPPQGKREIGDGVMSVNFSYEKVIINLQIKCNKN